MCALVSCDMSGGEKHSETTDNVNNVSVTGTVLHAYKLIKSKFR